MLSLTTVDISSNKLQGPIPDIKAFHNASFEALRDNMGICGNASGLKPCNLPRSSKTVKRKSNNLVILLVLPLLGSLLLLGISAPPCGTVMFMIIAQRMLSILTRYLTWFG
jgi:hypothetical protein